MNKVILIIIAPVILCLIGIVSIIFWPFYLVGNAIWGRAPNTVRIRQVLRYLRLAWSVRPPAPGLSVFARFWISTQVIRKLMLKPVLGVIWYFDEFLYGRKLNRIKIVEPLFIASAGRSGSTQIALYLEEDPAIVAPNLLQIMFPYLWLWRLVTHTIGKFMSKDQVREKIRSMMPPELLERHEGDPFKTDTFEGALYGFHLNGISLHLGPDVAIEDFSFGKLAPRNRPIWEDDFIRIVDRLARKTLYNSAAKSSAGQRFMIKGHFLCGVNALEHKLPDAKFLTILRHPVPRLRSAINYMRVNPAGVLGPVPWEWLSSTLLRTEKDYCRQELAMFGASTGSSSSSNSDGGVKKCAVPFNDFVDDLPGVMKWIYRNCLGCETVPESIPASHPPRRRTSYTVDRSLEELGIDPVSLEQELAEYIEWCERSVLG